MPETDVTKMKVADLKRELKMRGLATTGNKTELQDRLQNALIDGELSLEDTAISGEDLLDDDGVLTDEDEAKILGGDENDLLQSPTSTPTTTIPDLITASRKLSAADIEDDILTSSTTSAPQSAKKIVLKRKNSFTAVTSTGVAANKPAKENTEPSGGKSLKMSQRHPITIGNGSASGGATHVEKDAAATKVSQLSLQERLDMRAKKFGVSESSKTTTTAATIGAKKANNITGPGSVDSSTTPEQIEMLKKRAERFGCVVSPKIAKIDAEEKLEKRKQRFGGTVTASATAGDAGSSSEWADKARQRLERFKTVPTVAATTTPSTSGK